VRAWLTALRIARREALRHKGRSLLVVALIGLPVLGLSFVAVTYDTFRLSPSELATSEMGTGDALLAWPVDGRVMQWPTSTDWGTHPSTRDFKPKNATIADVQALLPAGTKLTPLTEDVGQFRTGSGTGAVQTMEFDYAAPIAKGVMTPLKGRAPAARDEVALTPYAVKRLGAGIGGTVTSADGTITWRVVGLVEDPRELRRQLVVFQPGTLPPATDRVGGAQWIADTPAPLTWGEIRKLNLVGVTALSRSVLSDPPPDAENEMLQHRSGGEQEQFTALSLIGGMLVLEVVLLAGPAFAVGARRRRRDLALVAASGGTPAHLRRIVLADGVVAGLLAAGAGVVLGILAALAASPLIEEYVAQSRPGAFRVYPLALAGLSAVAVTAGVLAALVPAWSAARQSVVAALSGRYGASRLRRRWLVAGLVMLAAGTGVTLLGAQSSDMSLTLGGLIVAELGLVLCTPALVGVVARFGRWLPLAPRIALRDIGRNRAAAAPAISAVLAAVAMSALLGTVIASDTARTEIINGDGAMPSGYAIAGVDRETAHTPAAQAAAEAALRGSLPVTAVVPYGIPVCKAGTAGECNVTVQVPVERRCPYRSLNRQLTEAEVRAAHRDKRCGLDNESTRFSTSSLNLQSAVIEPDALRHLTTLDGAPLEKATATLRAGGIVVTAPQAVVDGKVTVQVVTYPQSSDQAGPADAEAAPGGETGETEPVTGPPVVLPAYLIPKGVDGPSIVLSPATAATLGLAAKPSGVVAATSRMPTEAEQDRLHDAMSRVGNGWQAGVERPPVTDLDNLMLILAIAAGAITLGAAAIATGLAAADGKADLATLGAVGASPAVRRMLSLSQTGIIAGLGSALGIAAGLGAAAAVIVGTNAALRDKWPIEPATPIEVPWLNVAISLAVVPLVAMLGAGLLTRSRLPIERRM
jgi:putative ABC transport system permease protein